MGRRGPAPKPTWMKVLEGNPGKRPLKKAVRNGTAEANEFAYPDWLDADAKDHWNTVAPVLREMGLLTDLDLSLFAVYCQTYSDWVKVEKILNETGLVYVTPNGQARPRPELAISHDYMDAILDLTREFGMTPASRTRMNLPDPPDPDNEFQKWRMLD